MLSHRYFEAMPKILKQPAVGAVEPGRYAGLLVVDSDPLTDINVLLEEPTAVYKSGGLVSTAN
jgi:imidazolonepropionase-like amidohydrolase